MARTPKKLALGQLASTALTGIYTAPGGINTTGSILAFTNTTTVNISIDIYTNDGSTDFLQGTVTLPSGVGRRRSYFGFQRDVIEAGDSIKIQADSANAFNFNVSGSEVEIA